MSGEVARQEAPAAKETARDLDPAKAEELAPAGALLLLGGARVLSPSHLSGLQGLVGNAGVAGMLRPRPSAAPVIARQEVPDKRAAQWSHGWMAGSLKELAALPPAELTKVEAHAKDPDVDVKRFEIMLTAVRLSKSGGAKDWQLRDLYQQMQGAGVPQDQQQEVATFVGAFGLFTPKAINEYVKDVGDIFAGWAELGSAEARAQAFGYLINRQLGYQRVPPVKIVVGSIASGGEFDKDTWTVTISTRLGALNLTPEQQSDLIRRAAANFLHEARHAEQIFTIARARAGAGGLPDAIAKDLKIPSDIASKAHGLKLPPGSPEAVAAKAWYESEFGAGKAHRDAVLNDLDKRHDEYAALPEESDAHALGVAVSDRIQGGVPAPAGAAGGDAGAPPGGVQRQFTIQRCGPAHPDCGCEPEAGVPVQTQREVVVQRVSAVDKAIESGEKGDTSGIAALDHAALQLATPSQKIKIIKIILDKGGPTHRLELLWNNLKDPDVEANIDLWKSTWDKHAGVMGGHARKQLFAFDVADVANAMLTESEALCEAYLKYYGLTPDAEKSGQSTPARSASLSAVQDKAAEVMGAQTQLKALWAVRIQTDPKYLGPRSGVPGSYPFELDNPPMYASESGRDLWKKSNDTVKELTSSIDGYLEAYPELYPLVMSGKSSKKDAYADPSSTKLATEKPLEAVEKAMRDTIKNIHDSKGSTVELLARERKLAPVEQQLLAGSRTSPKAAGRNWKTSPMWAAMVASITEKPGLVTAEGAVMLGIQIVLAVSTGGIGNLLFSAAQAALSAGEASAMQTASDTALSEKDSIVKKQDVAAAKMAAAVDAAFLILDIVPGLKQARGIWGTVRGEAKFVQAAAEDLAKKSLAYEGKLMAKAEKAELEAMQKGMQTQADEAAKRLTDVKSKAAKAAPAEKALVDAEVRKAEQALAKAQASVAVTKALSSGQALVVELGGRRFSWVAKRGLVICASPCGKAADWLEDYGQAILKEAQDHSKLAGDAVQKQIESAKKHLRDIDWMLTDAAWTKTPTPAEFQRAAAHASSVIGEVDAQKRFAMLRYPLEAGGKATTAIANKEWAELVFAELKRRHKAIEDTDKAFFGSLPGNVKNEATAAHAAEWEKKLGKFPDPAANNRKLSSLSDQLAAEGKKADIDLNKRAKLMEDIDISLTNFERELRGQRELVLSGAELKAFTDEAAGKLLYPGMTAKELANAKKPDYIAELGNKLILGDSKGAGDVRKSIAQIEPALDTEYVKNAVKAGKSVECRVYLNSADAIERGYKGVGHPPVLHERLADGKFAPVSVRSGLPLYVFFN